MFEFTFQRTDFDQPILVTQISVNGGEYADWKAINGSASKRAVKGYAVAVGIETTTTTND